MAEPTVGKHIAITPGTCGGKPRIAGTRIRVQDIVVWTEQGMSPDEIVTAYPHLTLADVHAGLSYYHDHREEIDNQMQADDEFVAQMKSRYSSSASQQHATAGGDDPVPSR